jgi:hypothetical protein
MWINTGEKKLKGPLVTNNQVEGSRSLFLSNKILDPSKTVYKPSIKSIFLESHNSKNNTQQMNW